MVALPRQDALAQAVKRGGFDRRTADLGDGYVRLKRAGLNNERQTFDLTYTILSVADAQAIEDALDATGGVDTIEWTPLGETVQRNFYVESYSSQYVGPVARRVTATLVEKFL